MTVGRVKPLQVKSPSLQSLHFSKENVMQDCCGFKTSASDRTTGPGLVGAKA